MEKLFKDKETFQKNRPLHLPNDIFLKMCEKMAEEIVSNGFHSDKDQVSEDLQNHVDFNDDGYDMARTLDDSCHGYNTSAMFVDHLDCLGNENDTELRKLVKQWVSAHDLKPKYKIGDKLKFESKLNIRRKEHEFMFITGIREETAEYLMHEEENYKGGYVLRYERVEPITSIVKNTKEVNYG